MLSGLHGQPGVHAGDIISVGVVTKRLRIQPIYEGFQAKVVSRQQFTQFGLESKLLFDQHLLSRVLAVEFVLLEVFRVGGALQYFGEGKLKIVTQTHK